MKQRMKFRCWCNDCLNSWSHVNSFIELPSHCGSRRMRSFWTTNGHHKPLSNSLSSASCALTQTESNTQGITKRSSSSATEQKVFVRKRLSFLSFPCCWFPLLLLFFLILSTCTSIFCTFRRWEEEVRPGDLPLFFPARKEAAAQKEKKKESERRREKEQKGLLFQ